MPTLKNSARRPCRRYLFCGAGGSSTGARRALASLGFQMNLVAVNHWNVAIETHSRNHPQARHYCQDVNAVKPAEVVPEGKLDLLMASPTCTYHSRARGGKPMSDQGRVDPWAIVHWCTELRVRRLLVENVPEFVDWGPLDLRTGRPIKRRRGEYFRAWTAALQGAGFTLDWRVLNAADFGDATTRERFFLMARSDGKRVRWPDPTHSRSGEADLLGHGRHKWRAAREIIDWSIEGKSIFSRKRPLSRKTLARIYAGAVKFAWPAPFLVILRNHMDAQSLDEPLPTLCAGGTHIGLAGPFLLNRHGDNGAVRAHDIDHPMPTADCRGAGYLCEPFIANLAHAGADQSPHGTSPCAEGSRRAVEEPLQTLHAGGLSHALVAPFIMSGQSGGRPRPLDEPMPGMTGRLGSALIAPYYGSGSGETCRSTDEPPPTITTKARFGLIMPVTHGKCRNRVLEEPLPTVTGARRRELACIPAFARTAAWGERAGQAPRVHSVDEPTPTICATGRIQVAVAEPVTNGRTYDIRFRMLEPKELARAIGFSDEYAAYEFAGNKTEITKQIGNAVPVNLAAALVGALMRS
jgi:DNA (cytosine-5)-methyltransferase 1